MSVDCISWAFKLKLPPMEKFVLVTISDRADKKHGRFVAWPSYRDMCERTGYTESTIKRAWRHLEEWGLITREARETMSRRTRSNLYILHVERVAPEGLIDEGATETPLHEDDSEESTNSKACDSKKGGGVHSGPPVKSTEGDSCGPQEGTRGVPSNMNRKIEPLTPQSPPENETLDDATEEARRLNEGFRRLINCYQKANKLQFVGNEHSAMKTWRKLPFEKRERAIACWPLYHNGFKAQFAKWTSAKPSERGRKPVLCSASDYLRLAIFETISPPIERKSETPEIKVSQELIDAVYQHKLGEGPRIFIERGTAEFKAWQEAFQRVKQVRGFIVRGNVTIFLGLMSACEKGSWFPSEWPPGFEPDFEAGRESMIISESESLETEGLRA